MLILITVLIANQHRVPRSEAKVRPLVIGGNPKTMFLAGIVSQSSWGEPLWNTKCIKQLNTTDCGLDTSCSKRRRNAQDDPGWKHHQVNQCTSVRFQPVLWAGCQLRPEIVPMTLGKRVGWASFGTESNWLHHLHQQLQDQTAWSGSTKHASELGQRRDAGITCNNCLKLFESPSPPCSLHHLWLRLLQQN